MYDSAMSDFYRDSTEGSLRRQYMAKREREKKDKEKDEAKSGCCHSKKK
jgi:hypothetical protein